MIKMLWVIGTMTAQGPLVLPIPEMTTFKDRSACERFGAEMNGRLADYARGVLKLDWSIEVEVIYECSPNGQPA